MRKQSPNIYDAWNFFEIQRRQLVAGYDMLRRQGESGSGRHVVLVGLLVALGSFNEGANVVCKLNPALETVRAKFATQLHRWYRLRNDVAHVFERIFSAPRPGQNVPWIPAGLSVGTYNAETDVVSTGSDPEAKVELWKAIETAFELSDLLMLVNERIEEAKFSEYRPPIAEQISTMRRELLAESQAGI